MLTDNLQHDHHAVNEFVKIANMHLTKERSIAIKTEIHFSDGAPSQYKCAAAFGDISFAESDYNFSIHRCFFGSEHGKGESDGETGVLKSKLDEAIRGEGLIVNNATDLYNWCRSSLCDVTQPGSDSIHQISRRSFFLIPHTSIPESRQRTMGMVTLPQTRKVYSVKSTGKRYKVATRDKSCFCQECLHDNFALCSNAEYVGPWKIRKLKQRQDCLTKEQKCTKDKSVTAGQGNNTDEQEITSEQTTQATTLTPAKPSPLPISTEHEQPVAGDNVTTTQEMHKISTGHQPPTCILFRNYQLDAIAKYC